MKHHIHHYALQVVWDGNSGLGTTDYRSYDRDFRIGSAGKPDLSGSADAAFHGNAKMYNPEDFFLGAISACHTLVYLALCAGNGVCVQRYEDQASGTLEADASGGRFTEVTLRPQVTITVGCPNLAMSLHADAAKRCFIANSCSVPISHDPRIIQL
jgi:organic hydroperoxide reductase OsmC/OhrA